MKIYKTKDNNVIDQNIRIIAIIKKINISLFILNFILIRFNYLSPGNLKIYYNENKLLINIIYSILGFYYSIYLITWAIEFYQVKKITIRYSKLR